MLLLSRGLRSSFARTSLLARLLAALKLRLLFFLVSVLLGFVPASRLLPSPGKLVQSVLGEQGAGLPKSFWATGPPPLSSPALAISLCLFQASSPHSICHLLSSKGPRVLLRCRQALSLPACRLDAADRAEVQGGRPGPPCLIQWPPAINGVVGLRVFGLPLLQRPRFMLVKTRPLCRSVSEFAARLCGPSGLCLLPKVSLLPRLIFRCSRHW